MRTKFVIAALLLTLARLHAADEAEPAAAQPGARSFTTAGAAAAQNNYKAAMMAARLKYAAELDQAVKAAMTAGNLEDANAINEMRQKLTADSVPASAGPFKIVQANEARLHYDTAVTTAQRQYGRELQQALKVAMSSANLNEANEINGEIKSLVALLTAATPPAAPTSAPPAIGQPARTAKGLQVVRYPRHPSQGTGDFYEAYVEQADLGKPLGAPKTVKSLSTWTKDINENAVVSGFIKIEKAGTYEFRTDSDFDRNELVINGRIVCKFRDGSSKAQSVHLKAGLLPITSIAYANRTEETHIQWKPPGQEWSDIPDELLFH